MQLQTSMRVRREGRGRPQTGREALSQLSPVLVNAAPPTPPGPSFQSTKGLFYHICLQAPSRRR